MSDPDLALNYYLADPNYDAFDGESRAKTMHWMYNLKEMGTRDFSVTADVPLFAVFKKNDVKTYIAFNSSDEERTIYFSDGFSIRVPSRELRSMKPNTVSVDEEPEVPTQMQLEQNYPNPFNPSTTITYTIPESGMVQLSVYNMLGQRVDVLVDTFKRAGNYSVAFEAGSLDSGVYFYQLEFGGTVLTRNMVFMK